MRIYLSKKISSKKLLLFFIACCYFSSTFGQIKINSSNNVGIGGEPIDAKLYVNGIINSSTLPLVIGTDIQNDHSPRFATFYDLTMNGNTKYLNFGKYNSYYNCGELSFTHTSDFNSTNNYVSIGLCGSSSRLNINGNGNVGIGTTDMSEYKLNVAGDILANGGWLRTTGQAGWFNDTYQGGIGMIDNNWMKIWGNKNFWQESGILRTDGVLQVGGDGSRFLVAQDGKVSIGTTTPSSNKLNVAGTIYASGDIITGGSFLSNSMNVNNNINVTSLNVSEDTQTGSLISYGSSMIYGELLVGENGEKFIVDYNGNVRIGNTTASTYKLNVAGDIHSSNIITDGKLTANSLNITGKINSNTFPLVIGYDVPSDHIGKFATFYNNSLINNSTHKINFGKSPFNYDCGELSYTYKSSNSTSNYVSLGLSGASAETSRFNINGDGSVGIGTTTPKAKLDVNGDIAISNATIPMGLITEVGGTNPLLNMSVNFRGSYRNTTYRGGGFRIDTRSNAHLFQWLTNDPVTASEKLLMALTPTGLIIGNFSYQLPSYTLHVVGKAYCSEGVWVTSDSKVKENIETYNTNIVSKVSKLKAYRYQYKDQQNINEALGKSTAIEDSISAVYGNSSKNSLKSSISKPKVQQKRLGLLANEVKDQFPELVNESADGTLALDYMGMIPILLEAIKELDVKTDNIEKLKSKNDSLLTIIKKQTQTLTNHEKRLATLEGCVKCTDNQKSSESTNFPVETVNSLGQNSPNPFSEQTSISYTIADDVKKANIYVYDMQGKQKKSYSITTRGQGSLTIQGYEYVAGMYMYSLVTDGNELDTKRMILTE